MDNEKKAQAMINALVMQRDEALAKVVNLMVAIEELQEKVKELEDKPKE